MKISLITDAPKHNLALMKLSTYHKKAGDEVSLNAVRAKTDYTYASWIFEDGIRFGAEETGGVGLDPRIELPQDIEKLKPDYSLFNLDHSLGYTFRACLRRCPFCKVPLMRRDMTHHSIWEFHEAKFKTIELLNNNTFYDPFWENTFKEIYEARLSILDNSGQDLRLLDDHKAWWIRRLRWKNEPKFAWDRMRDEEKITQGLRLLRRAGVKRAMIYVLMGFETTFEEDLYRCEIINSFGHDPFPMPYRSTPLFRKFRRFIYLRYYRRYPTIAKAWADYSRASHTRR